MNLVKTSIAAAALVASASAASALTTPDFLFVESAGFRGDGTSSDVVNNDLGVIDQLTTYGIAGRIKNQQDTFTFTAKAKFDVLFVDLADLGGIDLDASEGFDSTFVGSDSDVDALFTFDGTDFASSVFTSSIAPDFLMFNNLAAGDYTFTIDGSIADGSSTYDIVIVTAAIPLPAAGILMVAGLGALGALRRKAS